ncbi:hypothetical protein CHH28_14685 [Bacterioplanes sanyensis]|uniref:Thiol:disulfide interchange protein n=1 Tax=Bacterioplanes sanyensis TaxID=1249553 RepID=A0A222FNP6_9GAMM|nr:thioredoxin fold domain-containing protein [Bacterioplanes sanyensis]ASP39843.1 hypothetical protein CHH28_14685 [Bacterioplanes sanyensis]
MNTEKAKEILEGKLVRQVVSVRDCPLKGFWEVFTDVGIMYLSDDGHQLIQGSVIDIQPPTIVNLTESSLCQHRVDILSSLQDDIILYEADQMEYEVTVFIDMSQVYCRKLYRELSEYLRLGISVGFLAHPEFGGDTPIAADMETIWTSKNPKEELYNSINGISSVAPAATTPNVQRQLELAALMRVHKVPSIILPDGALVQGYTFPNDLLKMLQQLPKH